MSCLSGPVSSRAKIFLAFPWAPLSFAGDRVVCIHAGAAVRGQASFKDRTLWSIIPEAMDQAVRVDE